MIKLRQTDGSYTWVNPDHIVSMKGEMAGQTLLRLIGNTFINSDLSCDEIDTLCIREREASAVRWCQIARSHGVNPVYAPNPGMWTGDSTYTGGGGGAGGIWSGGLGALQGQAGLQIASSSGTIGFGGTASGGGNSAQNTQPYSQATSQQLLQQAQSQHARALQQSQVMKKMKEAQANQSGAPLLNKKERWW